MEDNKRKVSDALGEFLEKSLKNTAFDATEYARGLFYGIMISQKIAEEVERNA